MKNLISVILAALLLSSCCTTPAEKAQPDAVDVIHQSPAMMEYRELKQRRE